MRHTTLGRLNWGSAVGGSGRGRVRAGRVGGFRCRRRAAAFRAFGWSGSHVIAAGEAEAVLDAVKLATEGMQPKERKPKCRGENEPMGARDRIRLFSSRRGRPGRNA